MDDNAKALGLSLIVIVCVVTIYTIVTIGS